MPSVLQAASSQNWKFGYINTTPAAARMKVRKGSGRVLFRSFSPTASELQFLLASNVTLLHLLFVSPIAPLFVSLSHRSPVRGFESHSARPMRGLPFPFGRARSPGRPRACRGGDAPSARRSRAVATSLHAHAGTRPVRESQFPSPVKKKNHNDRIRGGISKACPRGREAQPPHVEPEAASRCQLVGSAGRARIEARALAFFDGRRAA